MRINGVNPGESPDRLVFGLGNPGPRFRGTRHNAGADFIDYLAERAGSRNGCRRLLHNSLTGLCLAGGMLLYLAKPQIYMNNSGLPVRAVMDYYYMFPRDILVIHDDIMLPPGEFAFCSDACGCTHKGVISVAEHLDTERFPRIGIGIGEPEGGTDRNTHVLGFFTESERRSVTRAFDAVFDVLPAVFGRTPEEARRICTAVSGAGRQSEISLSGL